MSLKTLLRIGTKKVTKSHDFKPLVGVEIGLFDVFNFSPAMLFLASDVTPLNDR